jgi:hypothetical protein
MKKITKNFLSNLRKDYVVYSPVKKKDSIFIPVGRKIEFPLPWPM